MQLGRHCQQLVELLRQHGGEHQAFQHSLAHILLRLLSSKRCVEFLLHISLLYQILSSGCALVSLNVHLKHTNSIS